jgi:CMP-N-acetylneuraminic acid synthetase
MKNKTVAFVPIKLNNERLPNKNILGFFNGNSLIDLTLIKLEDLIKNKIIDEYYIFCSDQKITEITKKYPNSKYLKRNVNLDSQSIKSSDIIKAFIQEIDSDIYVMVHVTSPFVTIKSYKTCINSVKENISESSFLAKKMNNFIWYEGKPLNFQLNHAPRTQDITPIYIEQSSPYVFRRDVFKRFNGRTSNDPFICEANEYETIDIDYKEDVDIAKIIYHEIIKGEIYEDYFGCTYKNS